MIKNIEDDPVCCACHHKLSSHIDEGDGWRCHSLGQDALQCECFLRKDRTEQDGISFYDLKKRKTAMLKELGVEAEE